MFLVQRPKLAIWIIIFYMFFGVISQMILFAMYDLPSYLTGREFDIVRFFMYDEKMIPWFTATNNGMFPYFFGFLVAYLCLTNEIKTPVSFMVRYRLTFAEVSLHSFPRSTLFQCMFSIKSDAQSSSHQYFGHKYSNFQLIGRLRYFSLEFSGCHSHLSWLHH